MATRRPLAAFSLAIAGALALSACGTDDAPAESPAVDATAETAHETPQPAATPTLTIQDNNGT
ncbi:MAG: hypothetical protein L0G23_06385, partial [Ruaniaceae bacterium]|nr:hypothetical protein [Ruaniaceae bacterium]